ncbi:membrane associated protein [Cryptosporidium felis]|nr:membrane associated protein [Cryptosporidium felis]
MLAYSITGLNFRAEETPLTKKLRYVLAAILVLQFILIIFRIISLTDTMVIFVEAWMVYLGYVVYSERSPCALFIFISFSFVRGVLSLLTTIEWLKTGMRLSHERNAISTLILITFIATPILSFMGCIVSYHIFKNLQVVEDVDDQLNSLLNSWGGLNPNPSTRDGIVNGANEEGTLNADTINTNGPSTVPRVTYAPFTGKSYKLSDLSTNSTGEKLGNCPVYSGT